MFNVVTYVNMENKKQDIKGGAPAPRPKTGSGVDGIGPESRDRWVILGKEELDVTLEVDVYQFAPSMAFK